MFGYYLSIYQYVKLWGMPNGQGWANEPIDIIEAITAFEIEQREIERKQIELNSPNNGNNGKEILGKLRKRKK